MTGANVPQMSTNGTTVETAVEAELRHIQDLVFVRDLLASRGASRTELRDCDAVIDGLRTQLAEAAKLAAARYAPRAA